MCQVGGDARPSPVRVSGWSSELLTAEAGREVGRALRAAVASALPGQAVILDLRRCRHAGYRALHELFGAVAAAHSEHEDRYVVVHVESGADEMLAALNGAAIERHAPVPVLVGNDSRVHILGRLTKSEADTLELVQRMGPTTGGALRAGSPLGASAASNRLRRLYRLRLVRRQERIIAPSGGREFVYEPLASTVVTRSIRSRSDMTITDRSAR